MSSAPDDFEPGILDQAGRLAHEGDRRRTVLFADETKRRSLNCSGEGPQVRALQRPAGGEIPLLGRPRQHRSPAGEFVLAAGAEVRGEPTLEDGVRDPDSFRVMLRPLKAVEAVRRQMAAAPAA